MERHVVHSVKLSVTLSICLVLAGCGDSEPQKRLHRETAMTVAQQLHEELDELEVKGNIDEQVRYFSKDLVRLDPYRSPEKGLDAFLSYARTMRERGYKAEFAETTVLDAWVEGGRMVEYGTTILRASFNGAVMDDPVNYLAVWRINPKKPMEAQIETIIWNPQKPLAPLERLEETSSN